MGARLEKILNVRLRILAAAHVYQIPADLEAERRHENRDKLVPQPLLPVFLLKETSAGGC